MCSLVDDPANEKVLVFMGEFSGVYLRATTFKGPADKEKRTKLVKLENPAIFGEFGKSQGAIPTSSIYPTFNTADLEPLQWIWVSNFWPLSMVTLLPALILYDTDKITPQICGINLLFRALLVGIAVGTTRHRLRRR
jgi:hypothetical protein